MDKDTNITKTETVLRIDREENIAVVTTRVTIQDATGATLIQQEFIKGRKL